MERRPRSRATCHSRRAERRFPHPIKIGAAATRCPDPPSAHALREPAKHLLRVLPEVVIAIEAAGSASDPEQLLVLATEQVKGCLHVFRDGPCVVVDLRYEGGNLHRWREQVRTRIFVREAAEAVLLFVQDVEEFAPPLRLREGFHRISVSDGRRSHQQKLSQGELDEQAIRSSGGVSDGTGEHRSLRETGACASISAAEYALH